MYNQYNAYQQPGGGTAVTTTQPGLTWNGTAWVPSAATVNSTTTHSSYASAVTSTPNNNKPATDLITTYTQYYHAWKAKEQEQERLAQTLPEGPPKQEAKRQAQWAKYYADQSSAAAHHYHNNPHAAPPSLPPAPPSAVVQQQPQAIVQPATVQTRPSPQQQQPLESPDGLKRYVHKCLQQCSGQLQMQQMQKEVERVIAEAIRNGTMHSTNWERRELLPIPAGRIMDTATAVQTSGGTAAAIKRFRQGNNSTSSTPQQQQVNNTSHYGPPSSYGHAASPAAGHYGPSPSYGQQQQGAASTPAGGSYYGPAGNHYGDTPSQDEKYKSKWKLQDKFPAAASTPKDFVSTDNYYGKSNKDLGDDDFVSLSSNKIARKRKRTDKASKVKVKKEVIMQGGKRNGLDRSSTALEKRASRFSGAGGISEAASLPTSTIKNMDRFMGLALIGGSKKLDDADYEQMKVKGTCQTLEKEYLRLTAPPRAERVRPQPILSKHLENLKEEWAAPKHRDYAWFCSQLKAVRQDLTVQQIVNAFAVDVYETHARIALEEGDLNEYNQCQTQLKELYKTLHADAEATKNQNEFIAYRLIYYVFLQGNKKYEGGSSDLFNIMLSLTPEQRQDPFISHALKVRVTVAEYDYHAFHRLLKDCSRHGTYLMNYMIPKVRHWTLQRICKAYRPSVPTKHVLEELGFNVDKDFDFGKKWLESCGVVLSENGDDVLAKDSVVRESDLTEKASSLI